MSPIRLVSLLLPWLAMAVLVGYFVGEQGLGSGHPSVASWVATGVIELVVAAFTLLAIARVPFQRVTHKSGGNAPQNFLVAFVVLGLMLTAGVVAFFAAVLPTYLRSIALANGSQTAVARIISVYDDSHEDDAGVRTADYAFMVGGESFEGKAPYNGSYSDHGTLDIHYLPNDPTFSAIDPKAKLQNARLGVGFMALWNVLVFFGLVASLRQRRRLA